MSPAGDARGFRSSRQEVRAVGLAAAALAAVVTLVAAASATAGQTADPPASFVLKSHALTAVGLVVTPGIDVAPLLAEDEVRARTPGGAPTRFAQPIVVQHASDSAGTWETLADGSRLWRLRIVSPGALSLNLGLDRFDLPDGGRLWVYDPHGELVHGPYTSAHRTTDGALWTPMVLGDEAVLEVHLPATAGAATVVVGRINHGYRLFGKVTGSGQQGSCNIDVVCPEGDPWQDQVRAVACYTLQGYETCTATLLNNTAEDLTPYMLTAEHCEITAANASSIVMYWNFFSPTCGQHGGGSLAQNQTGASLVASWDSSDFALIELNQTPPEGFDVYYAGWDATGDVPARSVGIHHPSLGEKSLSFENQPLQTTDTTHWLVNAWDEGTTEGGSSGSCLFDADSKLCVGDLTGGLASCQSRDMWDVYGKLSLSYNGGGSSTTRLRDWLDPIGSGVLTLQGRDPDGGTPPVDEETPRWLIAASASAAGSGGSNWKTQVAVVNPTDSALRVSLHLVARGENWPGELLSGPFTLSPEEALYVDDPLLPHNPAAGLLWIGCDRSGSLVTSRTYNLAAGGATYGQGIPAISLEQDAEYGELVLPMVHSIPGRFHTNLGLVQASTGSYTVEVTVYTDAAAELGQKRYTRSSAFDQINDLFAKLGIGQRAVEGGWIRVRLVSGSPDLWTCYASVVDDLTGDPTFVAPVPR